MKIGQFFPSEEKIGTLSESGGVLTLQPSHVKIGGLGVTTDVLTTTLSGLTSGSLYMVYLVLNSGTPQLVVDTNFNSVGPTGYTEWALVGAFYAKTANNVSYLLDINDYQKYYFAHHTSIDGPLVGFFKRASDDVDLSISGTNNFVALSISDNMASIQCGLDNRSGQFDNEGTETALYVPIPDGWTVSTGAYGATITPDNNTTESIRINILAPSGIYTNGLIGLYQDSGNWSNAAQWLGNATLPIRSSIPQWLSRPLKDL